MTKGLNIILLIPYFGEFPEWMSLFVDSLKRNFSVDFLFITNCDTSVLDGVSNIHIQKSSFDNYVERFKPILGNDIQINSPYKICDLRPFFGLIHEQDIEGYDFFGWTDVDIFFGDIRSFYTDEVLKRNDVLSTHNHRLSGHFSLLRNTKKYREMGFNVYNWKKALQNQNFVGIDEHGLSNALCMTLFDKAFEKFRLSTNNKVLNFLRKYKTRKYYFKEQYTTPFTSIPWIDGSLNMMQPDVWFYDKGVITNERDSPRKFMYVHIMNYKSSKWLADGESAPWSKLTQYYFVQNTDSKIIINFEGIAELIE